MSRWARRSLSVAGTAGERQAVERAARSLRRPRPVGERAALRLHRRGGRKVARRLHGVGAGECQLALRRDELRGLHANTHIPQAIAAARRYEISGDTRFRDVADFSSTR